MTELGREEGELGPFFEAARAARPAPDARLLSAVLADAAAEAQPGQRPLPGRPWPAAAAMAASVALGFWLGASGLPAPVGEAVFGELALGETAEIGAVTALDPDGVGFFEMEWEG